MVTKSDPTTVVRETNDISPLRSTDSIPAKVTNNYVGIERWLKENAIAKPTGHYGRSGYCIYPEYEFGLEKF